MCESQGNIRFGMVLHKASVVTNNNPLISSKHSCHLKTMSEGYAPHAYPEIIMQPDLTI